jgi:hypothetical protein
MKHLILACFAFQQAFATTSFEQDKGTRHIWQKPPGKDLRIKFLDVPTAYDDALVKHADLVGMVDVFTDGQTWLMMDGKRLFQAPTDGTVDPEAVRLSTDVEVMGPDELREALKTKPPYEEAYAKIRKALNDYYAVGGAPRGT